MIIVSDLLLIKDDPKFGDFKYLSYLCYLKSILPGDIMSRNRTEAINAGVNVCETKHSMKRRKPSHNYSARGTYMLTLVVEGRQPLLGTLRGDGFAPQGTAEAPRVELSPLGQAIRDVEIKKTSHFYPMVEVWKLCIMPDHIHMIVRVKEDMPKGKHLGQVVSGFKAGCTRAWWRLSGADPCGETQGTVPAPATSVAPVASTTSAAPVPGGSPSGLCSPPGLCPPPGSCPPSPLRPVLFEQGYCDKILFRDGQLDNWKRYLDDNPRRLAIKRQCPSFFTVVHQVNIGEWSCQMVGNRHLLSYPEKAAIIVHSHFSDEEFAEHKQKWLALAENGGVLISAAIATREKEVMREAMNRGYRLISLRENGFPPFYKPSGESFAACTNGTLLQISPWEYHMNRRTISREQCLQLNRLAEELANYQEP